MYLSPPYTEADFGHSPLLVFYEVTRACDLACRHCRACAMPRAHPHELDTAESLALLRDLSQFPRRPMVVFTGGDPFKRDDLPELVGEAAALGLTPSMSPSATPLVTLARLQRLQDAGLRRVAVSLDGADARTHDQFRMVSGTFEQALRMIGDCGRLGLPVQVNTTIARHNAHQINALAKLLASMPGRPGVVMWSVFFLVPVGRGLRLERIAPRQYEQIFGQLLDQSRRCRFAIKTTEAPFYRRFLLRRGTHPTATRSPLAMKAPLGVNDGKGVMFISHVGQVQPSGFLPIECGRFPRDSVVTVYQRRGVFRDLRDPDRLKGKCGRCEYRHVCGGSRARAYQLSGDYLAEEPDCVYQPRAHPEPETAPCSA